MQRKEGVRRTGEAAPFFLPHSHPAPFPSHPASSQYTEIILDPEGRGTNVQHCTARLRSLAKHTPAALVPVKCISRLICSLNEM